MTGNRQVSETADLQGAATVVIGEHVKPGCEERHRVWQSKLNDVAGTFPGFVAAEVKPPKEPGEDWTTLYSFDTVSNLRGWLNSRARQDLLDEGDPLHDRPSTQQVLVDSQSSNELVTVVVSHRVPADKEDAFLEWQEEMTRSERCFEGFEGAELFRPIPGVQEEWTAFYRFDTDEHLRTWMESDERRELLAKSPEFSDFRLKTIQSSFGSWFETDKNDEQRGPSHFTTSVAVYVGLYPTVMLLTLVLTQAFPSLKMWQSLLIGNLVSSFVMTYVTMPLYVNKLLRPWLTADKWAPQPATTLKWLAISTGTILVWAVVFWLLTTRIWTPR